MVDLPENARAWFPDRASPAQAVGVFVHNRKPPYPRPLTWASYHALLADRAVWMWENSDPNDLPLVSELLESHGLSREPLTSVDELASLVQNGLLESRLRALGVEFPLGRGGQNPGRLEPSARLRQVGLLEWASSLLGSEPDQRPVRRSRPNSRRRTPLSRQETRSAR